MADKVRVLVVGLGNMGKSHASAYHRNPGFEIVGIMSRTIKSKPVPDELKGEAIVGFVVGKPGVPLDAAAVAATVVKELGPTFRPREIVVLEQLPKTQSGKIVRRLLRQKYLGEPLGDLSTVANPWALE